MNEKVDCNKCKKTKLGRMSLICDHDLCVSCGKKNAILTYRKFPQLLNVIKCEICGIATALNPKASETINNYQFTPQDLEEEINVVDPSQLLKEGVKPVPSNLKINPNDSLNQPTRDALYNQDIYPKLEKSDHPIVIQRCSLHPQEEKKIFLL